MVLLLIILSSVHLTTTLLFTYKIITWRSKKKEVRPAVSIIIAARNERDYLQALIPELLDQNYHDFEIIVGLDRCTDDSIGLLTSFQEPKLKWVDIKNVPDDWNSKKYALKQAIDLSSKEWLLFTDADCIPNSESWITSMTSEISEKTNVLVGISPYVPSKKFLAQFNQFEAFMTYFLYSSFHLLKWPYMGVGRNMGIKKVYFYLLGGYESIKKIRGGDDDLFVQKAARSGIALVLGRSSLVFTFSASGWREYLKQKVRHLSVGRHYKSSITVALSFYHLNHLFTWALMVASFRSSFLVPILLIYLFIKLVSYSFVSDKIGAGFNYILFPIVDGLYAIIIPVIGIWSKLKKDIEWKN